MMQEMTDGIFEKLNMTQVRGKYTNPISKTVGPMTYSKYSKYKQLVKENKEMVAQVLKELPEMVDNTRWCIVGDVVMWYIDSTDGTRHYIKDLEQVDKHRLIRGTIDVKNTEASIASKYSKLVPKTPKHINPVFNHNIPNELYPLSSTDTPYNEIETYTVIYKQDEVMDEMIKLMKKGRTMTNLNRNISIRTVAKRYVDIWPNV